MPSLMLGKLFFDNDLLQKDLNTIAQFPVLEEEYAEFGIGSWKNHSLWNEDGDFNNTQYTHFSTQAKITELGKKLPYISKMLADNFDMTYLKMVRARNLVNGFVIPHKDFVELNQEKSNYLRVFIPLENNPQSYHSDEQSVFQMQKGEVWRLDASIIHAAANFSNESRVHICLDFQFPNGQTPFESIFLNQQIAANAVEPTTPKREPYTDLPLTIQQLSSTINKNNLLETLVELSKLHFQYDVNIKDCYDWLLDVAVKSGSEQIVAKCHSLKKYMIDSRALGERFHFHEYH